MWQQMMKFGVVGVLATLVHMIVGYALITFGLHPLFANLCAFLTAFVVSFLGHLKFSFAINDVRAKDAIWKFGFVALLGFLFNETLLIGLLFLQLMPATVALLISTACAAVLTFWLSKNWAFVRK